MTGWLAGWLGWVRWGEGGVCPPSLYLLSPSLPPNSFSRTFTTLSQPVPEDRCLITRSGDIGASQVVPGIRSYTTGGWEEKFY